MSLSFRLLGTPGVLASSPLLLLVMACSSASLDASTTTTDELGTVGECPTTSTFVSRDACHADHQCGTRKRPLCTIAQGINVSDGTSVKVVASQLERARRNGAKLCHLLRCERLVERDELVALVFAQG